MPTMRHLSPIPTWHQLTTTRPGCTPSWTTWEACLRHMDSLLALSPEMAEDAAQDEHLRWALRVREMRDTRGGDESPDPAN